MPAPALSCATLPLLACLCCWKSSVIAFRTVLKFLLHCWRPDLEEWHILGQPPQGDSSQRGRALQWQPPLRNGRGALRAGRGANAARGVLALLQQPLCYNIPDPGGVQACLALSSCCHHTRRLAAQVVIPCALLVIHSPCCKILLPQVSFISPLLEPLHGCTCHSFLLLQAIT